MSEMILLGILFAPPPAYLAFAIVLWWGDRKPRAYEHDVTDIANG